MSDTYEATALFLRQRVLILQARLAEAETLLREVQYGSVVALFSLGCICEP